MAQLRILAQALPLSRTGCSYGCLTQLSPVLRLHTRPREYALRRQKFFSAGRPASTSQTNFPHERRGIIFSANQPADLPNRLSMLLPAWQLTSSKKGISRQFTFGSFAKAWRFMTLVAAEVKVKNHHPSWANLYNQVTVEWTTHTPEGLSMKDVEMAEFCDRKADEIELKK